MTGYQEMSDHLKDQYTELYGAYAPGDYPIGSPIKAPGVVDVEVIWSFKRGRQFYYVVANDTTWPTEIRASEVQS